jgi:hypothetical protein
LRPGRQETRDELALAERSVSMEEVLSGRVRTYQEDIDTALDLEKLSNFFYEPKDFS